MLKSEAHIFTFGDLLQYYPFRYVNKSKLYLISDINEETSTIQVRGTITSLNVIGEQANKRLIATLKDAENNTIELLWFKGINYFRSFLKNQSEYLVFGKPSLFKNKWSITHPDIEPVNNDDEVIGGSPFEGIYNTSEKLKNAGINSRSIHKLQKILFEKIQAADVVENLPPSIIQNYSFISRFEAFKQIHLPNNELEIAQATRRLKFEELFFIQLRLLMQKNNRNKTSKGYIFTTIADFFNTFYHTQLPFELTNAQKRVLKEIRRDTLTGKQMNRLVQGDVGSGKTMVALLSMLIAIDNGYQACLMAPTEILAQQHFANINNLLQNLNIKIDLLTGSIKGRKRKHILEGLLLGSTQILIGTHALIEDTVEYKNMGLAVIDEQHRFGVAQRAKLWNKNEKSPHILVMTATPIPRTLAMTLYGDLDISVIDELPPGRKAIKTFHYYENKRLALNGFLKQEIEKGRQIYIVYPLINESDKMSYQNLMEGYDKMSQTFPPPQYQISIVHGQMPSIDKDAEMQRFKNKETQIMIATTVIEVGVDIPNASVMVIESAERFGLSQLHQLRGRVGRGAEQSYCILMSDVKLTSDGRKRMKTMTETSDGFKIAEVDLALRGPGDLQGTQQSGILNLKIANIAQDGKILQQAREAAQALLNIDPNLQLVEHRYTFLFATQNQESRSIWSKIS